MSLVGKTVGHIRIIDSLGRGGMGEVYAGYDDRLERKVAVKAIGARLRLDAQSKARFLREARVLSQLDHPNICKIFDYIEGEENDYLVLEFIEGESLQRAVGEGLDKSQKLRIAEQIARVLVAAHEKGIIHRDLKPSNIMLMKNGEVKVLDFGLAKSAKGAGVEGTPQEEMPEPADEAAASFPVEEDAASPLAESLDATLTYERFRKFEAPQPTAVPSFSFKTLHGTVMGTPLYMSPEQARGEPVSAATDMYSFGLLLQVMFSGRLPYEDTEDTASLIQKAGRAETMSVTGVSPDLAGLINRLKSYAPTARPTAVETAQILRRIREKPKRQLRKSIAAGLFALAFLAGLKYTVDLRRERRQAIQARDEVLAVVNFLVKLFVVSDPGEARGSTITAREILAKGAGEIERELREQPLTRARLMDTIGTVYRNLGLYKNAEPLVAGALEIREKSLGRDDLEVAQSLVSLATLELWQGKHREAEGHARRSLDIREIKLGRDHPDVAQSLLALGRIYREESKLGEALTLFQRCLAIREKFLGPNHPDVAATLSDLGAVHYVEGRFEEAEQCYKRALAIREAILPPDHPDIGSSLTSLADLYNWLRRYGEAEPLYQRALGIREKTLGAAHPDVANCLNNIAVLFYYQKKYKEAEAFYLRALEIRKKALGENHPDVADNIENLGILCAVMGRLNEADSFYKQAMKSYEKSFGPEHPELVRCLNNMGSLEIEFRRYGEAEKLYLRGLRIMEKAFGPEHLRVLRSLQELGWLYTLSERFEEAEKTYQRALAVLGKGVEPGHIRVAEALSDLARVQGKMGRREEAEVNLRKALEICDKLPGPDPQVKAGCLFNLAYLYQHSFGRLSDAQPLYAQALAIREKELGPDAPETRATKKELDRLLASQKNRIIQSP